MGGHLEWANSTALLFGLMVLKFFFNKDHILMSLLVLEGVILVNLASLIFMATDGVYTLRLCFIAFAVVEACMGLAAIIQLARSAEIGSISALYLFKLKKLSAFKAENSQIRLSITHYS